MDVQQMYNTHQIGTTFEIAQKLWESKTHWTAITTDRGGLTRIISVRRSREEEVERYEQEH